MFFFICGDKPMRWERMLCLVMACLFSCVVGATESLPITPEGLWTTVSDKTHKPRSVVRLYQHKGKLYGKIVRIYSEKGDKGVCLKCPEPFKNQKIIGLRFLWDLKLIARNQWGKGEILDPKSGRIYRCKMTLSADGKKLDVRGFLGISLFGRTQTWLKKA